MAPTRFLLALNATFPGLALVLASLGLYGHLVLGASAHAGDWRPLRP
jgi:hypothetical protein